MAWKQLVHYFVDIFPFYEVTLMVMCLSLPFLLTTAIFSVVYHVKNSL